MAPLETQMARAFDSKETMEESPNKGELRERKREEEARGDEALCQASSA